MNKYQYVDKNIELESKTYKAIKRINKLNKQVDYSFDGENYEPTLAEAYEVAKRDGSLIPAGQTDNKDQDDFQVFMISLIQQLKELDPGESLKIVNYNSQFIVTKEKAVLAVRQSTIKDIELMEG